jgi:GT2 family glycosyltransferase
VSLVVPVHRGGDAFRLCLDSIRRLSPSPIEVIVVEDGPEPERPAYEHGWRVETLPARRGPAAARNHGAMQARGDVVFFIDADVVVPCDAVARVAATLADPAIDAVIGSYDRQPAAPNFVSQFKNLAHRYVHQQASEEAMTFWGACGAMRRVRLLALGGFDQEYGQPSIEDIELGSRLIEAGGRIRLRKDLEVTHLKRWTLTSLVRTDIRQRALPWSALLLRQGRLPNDLNVSLRARFAVSLTFLLAFSLAAMWVLDGAGWAAIAIAITLAALDWRLWSYFASERGWHFAVRAVALQWLYYAYSGAAFGWVWLTGDWRTRRAARLQEPA